MLARFRENMFWAAIRLAYRLCPAYQKDLMFGYVDDALALHDTPDMEPFDE